MSAVRQVDGNHIFEWKIVGLREKGLHESPIFLEGGRHYIVFSTSFSTKIIPTLTCWGFWLLPLDGFNCPLHYTLGFVDQNGKELLATKGIVKGKLWHESLLGFLKEKYLVEKNLLEMGTLTVRITFELDGRKETVLPSTGDSSGDRPLDCSFTALEHATQKEELRSSLMKDIFSNASTKHLNLWNILSDDFGSLYDRKIHADCVLKVGDSKFPVHRAVLSARSDVFAAIFNYDTKENPSREVDIPDVQPTTFSDVLFYVYSGKIRGLMPGTAAAMYTVADKYALSELKEICRDMLLNSLSTDNICDAAILAHTHGETDLENKIIQFIAERVEEFVESDTWKQFAQDECVLANKLLCSALILCKKKNIERKS